MVELNKITSATAWKERAHNENIAKKLNEAGYINIPKTAEQALSKVQRKVGFTVNRDSSKPFSYNPGTLKLNLGNARLDVLRSSRDYGEGGLTQADIDASVEFDLAVHEVLESIYSAKIDLSTLPDILGHTNMGVLVRERQRYNQTGANVQRKLFNLHNLRDITFENYLIDLYLPKKPVLKTYDYTKAIRKLNRANKGVLLMQWLDQLKPTTRKQILTYLRNLDSEKYGPLADYYL